MNNFIDIDQFTEKTKSHLTVGDSMTNKKTDVNIRVSKYMLTMVFVLNN